MSNKTALQELKLIIESVLDELPRRTSDFENGKEDAFNYVLSIINDNSIEKEKQQIMEAYDDGRKVEYDFLISNPVLIQSEQYFNSKYGNPQGDPETKR
ncbi:hypothetical protein [Elizabethkingia anophelis]|uniref:hypothetical protein n=1 Tax=Elizabethkingia anophelis TaxID=1117645 RepID=UPI001116ABAB|nr:hypothetical protein [Elizabethkingia anophelis]